MVELGQLVLRTSGSSLLGWLVNSHWLLHHVLKEHLLIHRNGFVCRLFSPIRR